MASEFKLPDLGENIESGDIVSVLVKEGDEVQADQPVFEVETGKAVVELPAPQAGKIAKVHVKKGAKVKVGDALLTFESAGGNSAPAAKAEPAKAQPAKAEPKTASNDINDRNGRLRATIAPRPPKGVIAREGSAGISSGERL